MAFENFDIEPEAEAEPAEEQGSGNRLFLIIAGVLGGLTVLGLACIAIFLLFMRPQQVASQQAKQATLSSQSTAVAMAITATVQEEILEATRSAPTATLTPTPVPPTATATPVIVMPTNTMPPTADPRTATLAALLTEAARPTSGTPVATGGSGAISGPGGGSGAGPTQPGTLPDAGFADDVGLPAMMGLALALIFVFFIARRLRSA